MVISVILQAEWWFPSWKYQAHSAIIPYDDGGDDDDDDDDDDGGTAMI